ncbi:hypothetical protein RJ639_042864 [Escallonia herrerae]|uniref:Uncharacterized protein n=1 Tax=Escallonia herrerae TaxID=1293975 RepID=A0AA88WDD5_9ASTE|nr:hypothetical protein RJ639_042864 [Escallonia herrerae]
MEPYGETRRNSSSYKQRDIDENYSSNELQTKMAELNNTNENLKQAKDNAMQSWLDSRPLIDELENLQADLTSAKNQSTISAALISDLQAQLASINSSLEFKKDEELMLRTMINDLSQELDNTREEMEKLKLETEEEVRARSERKQVLRLRRQTLRTLRLTLRAIRLESEAFGASAADALQSFNRLKADNTSAQLSQEDYDALTKRAQEETSLADWRIAVSVEQRFVAEESRDLALRRLEALYSDNKEKKVEGNFIVREAEKEDSRIQEFPKARARLVPEDSLRTPTQQLRRSRSSNSRRVVKKKKASIFLQIKTFLVQKIARLFG